MKKRSIRCFKAYDVRGQVPDDLDEDIAYRIGRAFVQHRSAEKVALGHDIRLSSPDLAGALSQGITDQGADVLFLGQCGTEEIYFAAFDQKVDGGLMVTASHNPENYNGIKFVAAEAKPISGETGLNEIRHMAEAANFCPAVKKGREIPLASKESYLNHLLTYIDKAKLKPLKIVVNAGNGGAGIIIDLIEEYLPFDFIKVNHQPDGTFPNGVPNPLLVENRSSTSDAIRHHGADLGVAWDGDFDRCFFFDENGDFISGYYIVGLLAELQLRRSPNNKVIYDPRLTWSSIETIERFGGTAIQSKTGHAFIKERMREENAMYGGEMSAHHYFRDFAYCDSGMIPWLLIAEFLSEQNQPFSAHIKPRRLRYPCSDEINYVVNDPTGVIESLASSYAGSADRVDRTDGLSFEFSNWRFNVRLSNTEPILRMNIETREDRSLLREKTDELTSHISHFNDRTQACANV